MVMQRQVLVIQKAPRTADVPLLQSSDTTVDVPVAKDAEKAPQEQHEDCMTKCNEIQMDKKQNDSEMIHREVKRGTKTKCYLREKTSQNSRKHVD